jgi:hypothetical protein
VEAAPIQRVVSMSRQSNSPFLSGRWLAAAY